MRCDTLKKIIEGGGEKLILNMHKIKFYLRKNPEFIIRYGFLSHSACHNRGLFLWCIETLWGNIRFSEKVSTYFDEDFKLLSDDDKEYLNGLKEYIESCINREGKRKLNFPEENNSFSFVRRVKISYEGMAERSDAGMEI